jgi:hypothetical protein
MFFLAEKTFSASQKLFSEAEAIFFESEKSFSITEKTVGSLPTMAVQANKQANKGKNWLLVIGDWLSL